MEALRELAHLLDERSDVSADLPRPLDSVLSRGCDDALQPAQVNPDRDEPLLCAVVQVAFDALPRFVSGCDDADAGRDQLGARGRV